MADDDDGEVEVEVEVEVAEEAEEEPKKKRLVPHRPREPPPPHLRHPGRRVPQRPREPPPAHLRPPLARPVPPPKAAPKGSASGSFLARRTAEMAQRDLACKAICRIKKGLRLATEKRFVPEDWDTTFKPYLGSYIRFLLSRPDQFKVTEGSGPGLFTVEDVTGNEVVSQEEVTKGKGTKGTGKSDAKGTTGAKSAKGGSKGKAKGGINGSAGGTKVSAKGGVLKGKGGKAVARARADGKVGNGQEALEPKGEPKQNEAEKADDKGDVKVRKLLPGRSRKLALERLEPFKATPKVRSMAVKPKSPEPEEEVAPMAEEVEPGVDEPPAEGLGWSNDFDEEAAEAAVEQAFEDAEEEEPFQWHTAPKRSSLIAELLSEDFGCFKKRKSG